jgi:HD-GYP domain-containing protein (c-di-GMP phosphodiesterase class II)
LRDSHRSPPSTTSGWTVPVTTGGAAAPSLSPAACLLAAADAYHTKTEPRPYREALSPSQAADLLGREARAGRLDAKCVAAVLLEAAGQHPRRLPRPAGLTEREAEVVGLLARGLQTKQVARALGISIKLPTGT